MCDVCGVYMLFFCVVCIFLCGVCFYVRDVCFYGLSLVWVCGCVVCV